MFDTTASHARWQHEQPGQTETVETLIRRAHAALAAAGLTMSPSKVSRRIRSRVAEFGVGGFDSWFLTYADPTGETAIRNIMAASR